MGYKVNDGTCQSSAWYRPVPGRITYLRPAW
jgi:hypothetical protein